MYKEYPYTFVALLTGGYIGSPTYGYGELPM